VGILQLNYLRKDSKQDGEEIALRADSFQEKKKVIFDEVIIQTKMGITLNQVLDSLGTRRQMTNGKSLHALFKILNSE
jgi:hypothetical protein